MSRPKFPRGKLNAADEGATKVAVGVKDGTVILAFPQPTTWIGLGYDEAKAIGEALLKRAEEIRQ